MKKTKALVASTVLAATLASLGASSIAQGVTSKEKNVVESIRPFRVKFSDEKLADLKRRILATQWPEKETVSDDSQGVPLAMIQELAKYWAKDYDWRKVEA